MDRALHILHLEDEAADAELIERELGKAGLTCAVHRVATKEAFLEALADVAPDLILADYTLPSFDGLQALALSQTQCLDVPFIFVSGTIGEEAAIEALQRGATDYVLKHRLSRLGPIVQRAFKEAEDRSARQRMERLKDELLDVLSHELRTPLTVVRESVSQLVDGLRGSIGPNQQECCQALAGSMERLNQVFEKVLLAAQIVTGRLACASQPTDLAEIMQKIQRTMSPAAEAGGVALRVQGSGRPTVCQGDERLLEQLLHELVDNAIRATPPGGEVTLSATITADGAELSVQDTGFGIPEEDLATFGERFRWVGGINDRKTGGLGLGCFIAQAIAHAHGGSFSVTSTVGLGTRVVVRLRPVASSVSSKAAPAG